MPSLKVLICTQSQGGQHGFLRQFDSSRRAGLSEERGRWTRLAIRGCFAIPQHPNIYIRAQRVGSQVCSCYQDAASACKGVKYQVPLPHLQTRRFLIFSAPQLLPLSKAGISSGLSPAPAAHLMLLRRALLVTTTVGER